MPKFYKQLSTCNMCKARFVVKDKYYSSSMYCNACHAKYFPKKEVQVTPG